MNWAKIAPELHICDYLTKEQVEYLYKKLRKGTTKQIAMDYGYSAREFNKLLHRMKIQHKVNGQWILYKSYMGKNYTTTKLYSYTDKYGKDHSKPLTAWTQRGRRLIYDVLKENGLLPLIERGDVD